MLAKKDTTVESEIAFLLQKHYGITGQTKALQGEVDKNYYVRQDDGHEYLFKVCAQDTHEGHVTFQHTLLSHIESNSGLGWPRVVKSLNNKAIEQANWQGEARYIRLLTWVPGRLYAQVNPHTDNLLSTAGQACGILTQQLKGFDHPGAHRKYKWDPAQAHWVGQHIEEFANEQQQQIVGFFYKLFQSKQSLYKKLPTSVTHNDINDYNLLVTNNAQAPEINGIIDFGDAIHTYTVNELAIALAYLMMGHQQPIAAACHVIKGFHSQWPLKEEEVEALFSLIAIRLVISVTSSMLNKKRHPDNEYLLISEKPAWDLLDKLNKIPESLAHYSFRDACGWPAMPLRYALQQHKKKPKFHPIIDGLEGGRVRWLDLSMGSKELGSSSNFITVGRRNALFNALTDHGKATRLGKYGEVRPFRMGVGKPIKDAPLAGEVSLGIDFFTAGGTPVKAAWEGTVHAFSKNDNQKSSTLLLKHEHAGTTFYTLYRSIIILAKISPGQTIKKGETIGTVASTDENGGLAAYVQFQIINDLLGFKEDFPATSVVATNIWREIAPDPALFFGLQKPDREQSEKRVLIGRRARILGKGLSLSYGEPLHIVRGYMQYLYDIRGRCYLDMVNNVAHVGHEHPKVVKAGQQQMAVLNTNTRYLHTEILSFAEDLLATLPPHLKVCHFVNSGSEANELALRMVSANTGQKDMVVVETGYHGNTGGCIDISSYKFEGEGGKGAPEHTHVVPVPDYYRGLYHEEMPDRLERYIGHIEEAVESIKARGRKVGGFIAESILSCAGQIVLPDGYLNKAYDIIHQHGGLCIADEVQVGMGRVGKKFWGFELYGVAPDIVTIGKPLGNGHPLAAVVCTEEVAERFNNGMEYFNTFGGNPVSCAIGRAVLEVVREERLQRHADNIGAELILGLKKLQKRYPVIGDVRGVGLFSGFELVRKNKAPAAEEAAYLANRMRDKGVLMSTDGPDHNVLKLKPPMCLNKQDLHFFLTQLEDVLNEDFLNLRDV